MALSSELEGWIQSGIHRIGEIEMLHNLNSNPFALCHWQDAELAREADFGGLTLYETPDAAREISNHDIDGKYRFAKAQINLRRGWLLLLEDISALHLALDLFYPAALGLFHAFKQQTLEVEHLRDKLNRQTGMYRYARNISDAGAQELVINLCGPAHECSKKILWQLNPDNPLIESEASQFNGIPTPTPEHQAVPLLCREACNHFVAQCRIHAKQEYENKKEEK